MSHTYIVITPEGQLRKLTSENTYSVGDKVFIMQEKREVEILRVD